MWPSENEAVIHGKVAGTTAVNLCSRPSWRNGEILGAKELDLVTQTFASLLNKRTDTIYLENESLHSRYWFEADAIAQVLESPCEPVDEMVTPLVIEIVGP
jgi:hypothetical protein